MSGRTTSLARDSTLGAARVAGKVGERRNGTGVRPVVKDTGYTGIYTVLIGVVSAFAAAEAKVA